MSAHVLHICCNLAGSTVFAQLFEALHDAGLALNLCDRVLILQEGRIARALDLRTADDAQVEEAMRALYGAVSIVRGRGGVALAPRERS